MSEKAILSTLSMCFLFFHTSSIKKFTNTRYLLHHLQNTLRYYKYNATRSKISCLPRGVWKIKIKKKSDKAKRHRSSEERSLEREVGGCLTDGKIKT